MSTDPLCYLIDEPKLTERVRSGDLRITISPPNWRSGDYQDPYCNRSMPLVRELAGRVPAANDFKVFYDPNEDFHHVTFLLGGEEYDVRWYKVYCVCRKSDGKRILFGYQDSGVVALFAGTKYADDSLWGK